MSWSGCGAVTATIGSPTHTITDDVALKQEYERIRAQGYSTDTEESVLEGCCFGAPVRAPDGRVIAAISLSLPKMRLKDKAMAAASSRRSGRPRPTRLRRWPPLNA